MPLWYRPGSPFSQPTQSESARLEGFAPKCKRGGKSKARAVDLLDRQRVEVGFGHAAQVDRRHLRSVGAGADRKALASACVAELMVDIVLVEHVRRQPVGAARQPDLEIGRASCRERVCQYV